MSTEVRDEMTPWIGELATIKDVRTTTQIAGGARYRITSVILFFHLVDSITAA